MRTSNLTLDQALDHLDPDNDAHWTDNGVPRMEALQDLTSNESLRRAEVTNAAPSLTRESAKKFPNTAPPAAVNVPDVAAPEIDIPTLPGLEPGVSVLDLSRAQVLQSAELTEAALQEVDEKIMEALKRKTGIENELAQLNQKSEVLKRAWQKHSRNASKEGRSAIQAYLATQNAVRNAKAKRVQSFLNAGTTPGEVAEALQASSKLDQALGHKRPGFGSQRPAALPVGA